MVVASQDGGETAAQAINQIEQKKIWRKKLGLDLPIFYFSFTSLSIPDTLYKIDDKNDREALGRLIHQYGNWPEIQEYYTSLNIFYKEQAAFVVDTNEIKLVDRNLLSETLNQISFQAVSLKSSLNASTIDSKFSSIDKLLSLFPFLSKLQITFSKTKSNYYKIKNTSTVWKNYIPKIIFYGHKNQYHRWLFGDGGNYSNGLIRGDFGISYVTKQPVSDVIYSKIGWSLFFSMLSVILAYMVSIPVGIKAATKPGSRFDRISSVILFLLYSMPSFWLATLLLMTFANPDVLHLFPASGVKPAQGYPESASLVQKIKVSIPYIILPLICYTYSSFAFISRIMRGAMIEVLGQDYIRTALAKGVPEYTVIWKHAFRNALLPIITIFANVFPAAIGGSVIIESIFTIPGIGSEAVYAIQNNNYPVIIAAITITGFLTLLGYLVADILYAIVDPRISYN